MRRGAPALSRPDLAARISLLYFATFLHLGVMSPFLPLWFDRQGLSPGWIAGLLALPLVLRPVAAPFVGWAGRHGHVRGAMLTSAAAAILLMAAARLVSDPAIVIGLFVVFALVWEPLPILVDTFAVMAVRAQGLVFGRMRSWGSAAFLLTTVAGGSLLGRTGVEAIPLLIAGLLLLSMAAAAWLPSDRGWSTGEAAPLKVTARPWGDIRLLVAVAAAAAIISSHGVLSAFASIAWKAQGFSSATIGWLWAVALASEIIFLRFAGGAIGGRDPAILLVVGGVIAALRWTSMAFVPAFAVTVLLQAMQGLSAMAPVLGLILIVARRVPTGSIGEVQGLATAAIGIVQALVMLAGGMLWPQGPAAAYMAMTWIAVIGGILAILTMASDRGRSTLPGDLRHQPPDEE